MPRKNRQFDKVVGKRLESVRKDLDFNKQQMANELGVEHDRYSSWENGKNGFPPAFAALLRRRRGVSIEWLYSDDPKRLAPEYFAVRKVAF